MKIRTLVAVMGIVLGTAIVMEAKLVPFTEDSSAIQAPQEIVDKVQAAAELAGFKADYEVAVPKKSVVEINPWNKFTAYGINPLTKNAFIVVNPEWFSKMPEDQQQFLLSRNFTILKEGSLPLSMKLVPYLHMALSVILLLLIYWLLGKTRLASQKSWVRALVAYAITAALNLALLNSLEVRISRHLGIQFDKKMNEIALQKTQNKDAALKALEFFDASIKEELKKGETFWQPYASMFEDYANELKKK